MLANALNASATVFDSLCEVDTKFAKLVDSECEGISSEVKKWFKRLAVSRNPLSFYTDHV